ncbi:MAG TPA: HNH endonuclease signature motif containing protein [Anaerolineales bacterium]|nr:HNH endonuclease signature motif containing protein [Anaerolineales bacterium]
MKTVQLGLFGDNVEIREESFEARYKRVLSSQRWKDLRQEAIRDGDGRCWECGVNQYSKRLELHHLTYEHLGKETLDDVELLCPDCHHREDEVRELKSQCDISAKKFNAMFVKAWETRRDNIIYEADKSRYYVNDDVLEFKRKKFRLWLFYKYFDLHSMFTIQLPRKIDGDFIYRVIYR